MMVDINIAALSDVELAQDTLTARERLIRTAKSVYHCCLGYEDLRQDVRALEALEQECQRRKL